MEVGKNQEELGKGSRDSKVTEVIQDICESGMYALQSPVNLSNLENVQRDETLALAFSYEKQHYEQSIFNNAYHLVPRERKSSLLFKEETYWLIDVHVHFPSEHILDGHQSEFEFHLVHENQAGAKLVIGLLYDVTTAEFLVKDGSRRATILGEFESGSDLFFNLNKYIPEDLSFYHFIGSLTTAPYDGPVLWFVMDHILLTNKEIVERVKKRIPINNNRETFPLKERKIWHN